MGLQNGVGGVVGDEQGAERVAHDSAGPLQQSTGDDGVENACTSVDAGHDALVRYNDIAIGIESDRSGGARRNDGTHCLRRDLQDLRWQMDRRKIDPRVRHEYVTSSVHRYSCYPLGGHGCEVYRQSVQCDLLDRRRHDAAERGAIKEAGAVEGERSADAGQDRTDVAARARAGGVNGSQVAPGLPGVASRTRRERRAKWNHGLS